MRETEPVQPEGSAGGAFPEGTHRAGRRASAAGRPEVGCDRREPER
jgi:hypothetical protein